LVIGYGRRRRRERDVHLVNPRTCHSLLLLAINIPFILFPPAAALSPRVPFRPSFIIIVSSLCASRLVLVRVPGTEAAVAARNRGRRRRRRRIVRWV
jgi:hypothetical protein